MTLRRMGFPEEGIELWRQYDNTRRMHVLTAYGYTDPISPECGAWGQGAVESPIGWLAFMCWMSAYVNKKSTKPYTYNTRHQTIDITKVIYADDGTYFQQTRQAAQNVLNAVTNFSTATGIIVKPQKSYAYSTCAPTQPLVIDTYTGYSKNTGELTGKVRTEIKELKDTDFYKHLGNIQNALGDNPIKPTELYDGTYTENIYGKINRELKALKSRNITAGGTLQAIKTVIYRQILYPMTYASTSNAALGNFKRIIDNTMRHKFKMPSHLHTDTLYMHEDAGGIGQDEIEDLVNVERLILLVNCLNQRGEMNTLMQGAIEGLQDYANISTNPLTTNITHYVDIPKGMWIFQLKQWMEKHDIQIQEDARDIKEPSPRIMDKCTRKTQQGEIWRWAKQHKLKYLKDLVYPDGTVREHLFYTTPTIRSSIIEQTSKWRVTNRYATNIQSGKLTPGRWIVTGDGKIGEIQERDDRTRDHTQIKVELYKLENKREPTRRYYVKAGDTITTDEATSTEVKMNMTTSGNLTVTEIKDIEKNKKNEQERPTPVELQTEAPGGLYCSKVSMDALHELKWHAQYEHNVITGASDGSVRDYRHQGTWAWTIMTTDPPEPWPIQGRGREYITGTETQETHSYRMEALGLLSALTFIRQKLHWTGNVVWYMDSQSVIDTFSTCHQGNQTKWVKQRDKDVWRELAEEKRRWGKDKITIHHVEAHADEKHKKGLRGPPTPIEKINIFVDRLADSVYTDPTVKGLQTEKLRKYGQWHNSQTTRSDRTLAKPNKRTNKNRQI